jgi:tRNA-splicing ligase RtcB
LGLDKSRNPVIVASLMKTYPDIASARAALVRQGPAEWLLPIAGRKPVILIANDAIMAGFDDGVFEQAVNTAEAPGVDQLIVGADGHQGFGCPVGSIMLSKSHIYPAPVGPDTNCSMSFLQLDVNDDTINDKRTRRALIDAICARIPTGAGARQASKARPLNKALGLERIAIEGAVPDVLNALRIPDAWATRCEVVSYGDGFDLPGRWAEIRDQFGYDRIMSKMLQLGSLGGGNHFLEGQRVTDRA